MPSVLTCVCVWQIVYSRWLVTQAVVLPDIDIEIPDDRSVAPSVHTQVQRLLATHGGLDRIISRSTTPSGKVTFNVKWKDGAETQVTHTAFIQ